MTENENEELKDIVMEGFPVLEHTGGDGWTILHGDTLSIVRAFRPGVFDAVITDPPYASGGAKPSEKTGRPHRNTAACARTRRCRILTATRKTSGAGRAGWRNG